MSDLIRREDVIKIIDEEIKAKSDYLQHNAQIDIMYKVQELPTVEAKLVEWIPCSEGLPEDETLLYWTTHEDGSLVLHGYKKSNGFIYNWEVDDLEKRKRQGQVIAWIPIFEPAPYNADMRGGKNE